MRLATLFLSSLLLTACGEQATPGNTAPQAGPVPVAGNDAVPTPAGRPELGDFGIDLSNRDPSIRPGDDFFRFANGLWLDTFELPADRSNYGSFTVLSDRSDERVRAIIGDLASREPAPGSIEQKISDYYLSYLDTRALNEKGLSPLLPGLAALAAIDTLPELVAGFGRAQIDNTASPFSFYIDADRADPDRHQLDLVVGGLGLPDRDYYLVDTERFRQVRDAYVAHIERVLKLAAVDEAGARAGAIMALETRIAEHLWPRADRRNADLTYNPVSYEEFTAEYTGFDWDGYFSAAGIENLESLNVSYPSAMGPVIDLINTIPVADWRSLMTYRFIVDSAPVLSEEIDRERFSFYSTVLNGVTAQRERWERGVIRVGALTGLGEAVGQIYVQRHFPQSAKDQMEALVENLRASLRQSIDEIAWMGDATKQEAYRKLDSFRPKIAYPDEWKDLSAVQIIRDDLFANARNIREFWYEDQIGRLGQATNREEWGMTPQTVNAYYNPLFNEIVFPAGILQPPFFDPNADLAVNYGGIGAVIGHEMGHGFDDQGSKFDWEGIQRNWWTDEDRASFEALANALAEQYAAYSPVEGYKLDGHFTLGENIGDLGGVSIAYRAYKLALNGEEAPVIGGLSGDQRFFLAYAQIWQRKYTEDNLIQRLTSDPHSPAEFRVNGVVRNLDEWYEAFDVQPEDDLYLPPAERIKIW